nr:hypothetical protein [Algiphilus aromaticivorans]
MSEGLVEEPSRRIRYLIDLVDREATQLSGVRSRLLGDHCEVDEARAKSLLSDDLGIDRLESFGAKFSRMQDTVMDKLAPAVLRLVGELPAAAADNLDRLERLGLVGVADDWLAMRRIRNRLVHEYIKDAADLALVLERACHFSKQMQADYGRVREYVLNRID